MDIIGSSALSRIFFPLSMPRFCRIYPVNQQDSLQKVPGVLFGRFEKDKYGPQKQGNPWVLLTAALANLLYKAAAQAAVEGPPTAWAAFGVRSAEDFVAAGDAVLLRLRSHMDQGPEALGADRQEEWQAVQRPGAKVI